MGEGTSNSTPSRHIKSSGSARAWASAVFRCKPVQQDAQPREGGSVSWVPDIDKDRLRLRVGPPRERNVLKRPSPSFESFLEQRPASARSAPDCRLRSTYTRPGPSARSSGVRLRRLKQAFVCRASRERMQSQSYTGAQIRRIRPFGCARESLRSCTRSGDETAWRTMRRSTPYGRTPASRTCSAAVDFPSSSSQLARRRAPLRPATGHDGAGPPGDSVCLRRWQDKHPP